MSTDASRRACCIQPAAQRGVTLIELIMFMIIVSVGVAGLVSVVGALTRDSADPMIRKQMITTAESLLNEVLQQPFTFCDPDDANAATANGTADCAGTSQDKGGAALTSATPATETRNPAAALQFDNVADYGGFNNGGADIVDILGINPMTGYQASVAVTRVGTLFTLPDDAVLRVTVTVTHDGQSPLSLNGYRFRYAPRN